MDSAYILRMDPNSARCRYMLSQRTPLKLHNFDIRRAEEGLSESDLPVLEGPCGMGLLCKGEATWRKIHDATNLQLNMLASKEVDEREEASKGYEWDEEKNAEEVLAELIASTPVPVSPMHQRMKIFRDNYRMIGFFRALGGAPGICEEHSAIRGLDILGDSLREAGMLKSDDSDDSELD